MTITIDDRFLLRAGDDADLIAGNPTPLEREMWLVRDVGLADGKRKIKIGDGVTAWNDLPYLAMGGGVETIVAGSHVTVDSTDPKNPVVGVSSLTATGYAEGTAFPTSPALDDKFYRTDINALCYYDGTRWLTVGLFTLAFDDAGTGSQLTSNLLTSTALRKDVGIFLVDFFATSYVASGNTSSSYWSASIEAVTSANVATTLETLDTHSDTSATWTSHFISMKYPLSSTAYTLRFRLTKTGTPGGCYFPATVTYRLIIT